MIDLGTVRPGSTIRIPFSSFDKDDGSSITMTNYAAADLLCYKDGSTTERASTAGFTATTDFDAKTGKHLAIIDLADDTTADFWKAGSEYLVAIDAVTVDAVTTGGWIARFRIGYPNAYFDTSIATLASQTSFTLTAGPAEDDALNGMVLLVHDKASAVQVTRVVVEDYTGSTKTVTLRAAPATTFTIAAGDNVSGIGFDAVDVRHVSGTAVTWSATRGLAGTALPAAAADAAGGLVISDAGGLDADAQRADVAAILVDTGTTLDGRIPAALTGAGNMKTDALAMGGATVTAEGAGVSVPTTLASRTNITGGTITTTTNVTTVNGLAANVLTAAALAADAVAEIQSGLASQTSVDDIPTNAELATALGTADDATLAAIGALNNLSQANVRTAVGLASANLDTQLAAIQADSPNRVTKNTALAGFTFFMRDSTNHLAATGLTITAKRSLDGAALGACANSATEISNGLYTIDLAAGDLNGNVVTLRFTATGADDLIITLVTQPT